ncbi:isoaspartyl peptidase/L-asparaginase [Tamlana sp. 2201CG12-4]|uniref:isoaspartyl peptidase/L-asparaginase family protein n=1 Tax=Tamlana sp. 2201CG12-4 TaxID=3112582 RepID=UPI002DB6EFEA|nr:isoaspartyl peptidase/L-asparaginase [Tamlana sp. 2201CG12-4]MEC3906043.1 isoaspartyl peptidase/L-asparaginase [Tamlana sp. 2201CG12-4]
MKKFIHLFLVVALIVSCKSEEKVNPKNVQNEPQKAEFSIVIHGGAGTIKKEHMTREKEMEYRQKLEEAIRVGYTILKNGGTSLDAVQKTITVLEDSPLFNAGRGAVLTYDGINEHDASIMDGKTLNAGASTGTRTVKNPINLARKVMDESPHVMLSGAGAETFAKAQGLDIVESDYFFTEKKKEALERVKASEKNKMASFYDIEIKDSKFGTVGCTALDKQGNLAAGTSTGGMTNKRWGRIGDSPIIGAGTYANNATCAVSSTGWGEFFIRGMVAHDISALMAYKNMTLKEAAQLVIQKKLPNLGGNGGIIAIDKNGNMTMEFNTSGMFRATMNDKGELYIGMFKD